VIVQHPARAVGKLAHLCITVGLGFPAQPIAAVVVVASVRKNQVGDEIVSINAPMQFQQVGDVCWTAGIVLALTATIRVGSDQAQVSSLVLRPVLECLGSERKHAGPKKIAEYVWVPLLLCCSTVPRTAPCVIHGVVHACEAPVSFCSCAAHQVIPAGIVLIVALHSNAPGVRGGTALEVPKPPNYRRLPNGNWGGLGAADATIIACGRHNGALAATALLVGGAWLR
jgi:hypothetical protein